MREPARVATGDRIGDYRVETLVRRGPRWDVCNAAHVFLPRRATVRLAGEADLPEAGVQLLREAYIVEALGHPGIPRLYDCGRIANRGVWIATERVAGRPLTDAIDRGPAPPARLAKLIRDLAGVLEHAHRRGIVYRALCPDTILLADADRWWPVCLVDWNEARARDAQPVARARGPHDAPEVEHATPYDGRLDIYSLGVVAYQALRGTQLFDAAPLALVADQVVSYFDRREGVTPAVGELARLMDTMLAQDPARRPTASDVRTIATSIVHELEQELADTAGQAVAMLPPEAIEPPDDPVLIQEAPVRRAPTEPTQPVARVETIPMPLAKIRKLKWTPPMQRTQISSEQSANVAGEIDDEETGPNEMD